ncbi:MAG: phosphoglucosamine mutase, partial [Acidobacteriota bacterium]
MTAPRLFGTDGVRGQFGTPPMDEATLRRLGAALGRKLRQQLARGGDRPPGPLRVVLGGDTRASTPQICRWLAAELVAQGFEPLFLGTVPTPAVAATAGGGDAVCGIAVSASHNPY